VRSLANRSRMKKSAMFAELRVVKDLPPLKGMEAPCVGHVSNVPGRFPGTLETCPTWPISGHVRNVPHMD